MSKDKLSILWDIATIPSNVANLISEIEQIEVNIMSEDMKKMKIVTVVGTRPEIIRLSRVMAKLDQYCEHVLIHTGQNYDYELNQIFFEDLGVRKPDHFLGAAGDTAAQTIAEVIAKADAVFELEKPEA